MAGQLNFPLQPGTQVTSQSLEPTRFNVMHYQLFIQEPHLHAQLIRRETFGNVVIDHEDVTRTFPEGPGRVELVCVYVVEKGLIQSASFAMGPQTLFTA